jgi:hypothetical protein
MLSILIAYAAVAGVMKIAHSDYSRDHQVRCNCGCKNS